MSDRAVLFIFGVFMIVAGVGAAVALVVTGQVESVDGLFLMLTCLLVALVFALYLMYMIKRAMESLAQPPAKPAAKPASAKATPVPAAQTE